MSTPEDTPSLHVRTNPPKKNENKKLEAAACTPKHIICSFRRRCHGTALVLHVSWLDPTQQWKALFGFFFFFFFFFLTDLCILYEFLLFACFILPNRTSVHTQLATRWQAIQLCSKFDGVYIVTNAEKYKVRNSVKIKPQKKPLSLARRYKKISQDVFFLCNTHSPR